MSWPVNVTLPELFTVLAGPKAEPSGLPNNPRYDGTLPATTAHHPQPSPTERHTMEKPEPEHAAARKTGRRAKTRAGRNANLARRRA